MNPMMQKHINKQEGAPASSQQASNKPEIIGLENVDLRQAAKIDLKNLEPGQGGYTFTWLGAVKFQGQYGHYYLVGVQDQNGSIFKFFGNTQINKMIDNREAPFNQPGTRFFIECKLKPGMKYKTKDGSEREAKGYTYNIAVL